MKKKSLYICVEVLEPIVMMLAEVEQIYPMSKLVDETIQEHRKTQKKDPKKWLVEQIIKNDQAIKGVP